MTPNNQSFPHSAKGRARSRLSLSMIVKDEEQFLPGCLESVRGCVDEIVIVDTGSTDRTRAIAEEAGAIVIQASWTEDFSAARNLSLERCTGDWVLYLDADERLGPIEPERLQVLLGNPRAGAYNVAVRSTLSLESGKSTQIMFYPRLFRRAPRVRFEGPVHEQIGPAVVRAGGKVYPSSLFIEHLGYNQGFSVLKAKVQRNLKPLLGRLKAEPNDWHAHLHVARSLLLLEDFPAVLHHTRAALQVLGIPRPFVAALNNILAEVMMKTGFWTEAVTYCKKSLSLVPAQIGARWFLAGAYVNSQDYRSAISVLEEISGLQNAGRLAEAVEDLAEDVVLPPETNWELLGRCYAEVGLKEKAVEALFKAVWCNPFHSGTAGRFWEMLEKLGQPATAIHYCEKLIVLTPADPRPLLYLALSQKRQGNVTSALQALDRVLAADPNNEPAISWKALWRLERKDLDGAEATLEEAARKRIVTPELQRCAFEVAVQRGRYREASERLMLLAAVFSPEQFLLLRQKISTLAGEASPERPDKL